MVKGLPYFVLISFSKTGFVIMCMYRSDVDFTFKNLKENKKHECASLLAVHTFSTYFHGTKMLNFYTCTGNSLSLMLNFLIIIYCKCKWQ